MGLRRGIRAAGAVFAVLVVLTVKLFLVTVSTVTLILSRTIVAVLSRTREIAADEAATEVVSSPEDLASALAALDDTVAGTPRRDLREAADISAMSIVPLEPPRAEPLLLGPDGTQKPFLWLIRRPIRQTKKRLFRTHPKTETRINRLRSMET